MDPGGLPLPLPAGISDRRQYFREALGFLVHYEWMYNFPVTEILSGGLLGRLPVEWWQPLRRLSLEDLRKLPRMDSKVDWPASLEEMARRCSSLRLPVYDQPLAEASTASWARTPSALRGALTRGMSPKKDHEVLHLAAYISERCRRAGVSCVVDMGSGIGYLCEVLHFVYGLRVVGLETNKTLVEKARRRHGSLCAAARVADTGGVRYEACAVDASPEPVMRVLGQVVDEAGAPARFCLVGLHSCGDLTPNAVKLFHSVPQVTSFVLVTCCYHRMVVDEGRRCAARDAVEDAADPEEAAEKARLLLRWMRDDQVGVPEDTESLQEPLAEWLRPDGPLFGPRRPATPEHFLSFPLSDELRDLTRCGVDGEVSPSPCQVLRRPLLRLASNETAERWHSKDDADLRCCGANLVSRAVYGLYAKQCALPDESPLKKHLLPKVDADGGLRFADDVPPPAEVARHRDRLAVLVAALEPLRPLLLAVVGLQTGVQHVCEAVILLDRQAALSASLAASAAIVKIGDPAVTPRCFALVADKEEAAVKPRPPPS